MSGTANPTPIVPTLEGLGILSDPQDILAYVLRWYVTVPKSISDSTPDHIISIADSTSRYQNNPTRLVEAVRNDLMGVYTRYFGPGSSTIDISVNDHGNGTYDIIIQIAAIVAGKSHTLGSNVTVGQDGAITLKFHPSLT